MIAPQQLSNANTMREKRKHSDQVNRAPEFNDSNKNNC